MVVCLADAGEAVEAPPRQTPADKLWTKAMKATALGKWDLARAILMTFGAKYPGDPRAQEARDRARGNAFLASVPYCLNGPKENRIDVYVSADGLSSGQKDQDLLKRIAKALCDEGLSLPPFDAYWPYFNWHIVHAGSEEKKEGEDNTCFGGRHGSKNSGGGDACMDFKRAHGFVSKHVPDYDLFLCYVEGWNGWPSIQYVMSVVGTANLRYVPRVLSAGRIEDAEIHDEVYLLPKLQSGFQKMMAEFKAKVNREKEKYRNMTVREWREMTASWDVKMYRGRRQGRKGRRDPQKGKAARVCWRITDALNQYVDWTRYPDAMHVGDRPLPPLEKIPWYHWLLKGDPSVTVIPTMKCAYSHTTVKFVRFHDDGAVEIVYPKTKKWENQHEVLKRQNGGVLPDSATIKRNIFITYYPHDRCHLGGAALPEKGGIGASPHYCAVCREEAVRAIYRYVSPIDDYGPTEKSITATDPRKKIPFTVDPMKPLDHALTVEWRVDGELQKRNTKREQINRKTGKKVGRLPPFPMRPRKKQYFDPAKENGQASARQVKSALAQASVAVRETFTLDPSKLSPGEHTVEVRVIDETDWVLWDPENLLTETVTWKVTVPEKEEGK
jgi:hypothetical protein